MQAYYDEKRKIWVFPGEDPEEKAKPIGPPPTIPKAESAAGGVPGASPGPPSASQAPVAAASDPLAAMMAPPKRGPANFQKRSNTVGATPGGGPPTMMMMMPPGADKSNQSNKTPVAPPQFAVFTPTPSS